MEKRKQPAAMSAMNATNFLAMALGTAFPSFI
jgi:hypothetical protein